MTGLSWLLIAVGASAQATEFQLDTDTPDALCPELSMTRQAVRQRLGQLETEAGAHWRGSYSTVHDPSGRHGDYVRLVIRDAQGKEHLNRELPLKGESCDTLAQAIALVVDGFFRELAQSSDRETTETPNPPPPGQPPESEATAKVEKPTAVMRPAPAQVPRVPTTTRRQHPVGLVVGAGYESVPAQPALDVGSFFTPTTHWQTQLRASFPFADLRETHGATTASAYVVPLRLTFSYDFEARKNLHLYLGPEVLTSLEYATAQEVQRGHGGWRASIGLGAQAGFAVWLTPSIALAGTVSLDQVFFNSRKFLMYGNPVLELTRTRLNSTLGIRMVIWP